MIWWQETALRQHFYQSDLAQFNYPSTYYTALLVFLALIHIAFEHDILDFLRIMRASAWLLRKLIQATQTLGDLEHTVDIFVGKSIMYMWNPAWCGQDQTKHGEICNTIPEKWQLSWILVHHIYDLVCQIIVTFTHVAASLPTNDFSDFTLKRESIDPSINHRHPLRMLPVQISQP